MTRKAQTVEPTGDSVELHTPFATPKLVSRNSKEHVLVTGGAGFIGTNLADRLLTAGHRVLIADNLSRSGSEVNLSWLSSKHGSRLRFERCDVRNFAAIKRAVQYASTVFHFAAQVAVTSSLSDPRYDFDVNAGGTLQVLEAIRHVRTPPALVFTSTNKVYGALADLVLFNDTRRYLPASRDISKNGVSERRSLEFHSPYGCSKGAADQYILDYARTFHLPAVVFRMSCIYGPHQNGTEDQGWVAHFLIRSNEGAPIRIYGDGMQVRDVLFVTDLLDAFERAVGSIEYTAGQAFNIGGGSRNTVSLLELLDLLQDMHGERIPVEFAAWRHADQRYYASDIRKFQATTAWEPRVSVREGLQKLQCWLVDHRIPESTLTSGELQSRNLLARNATVGGGS